MINPKEARLSRLVSELTETIKSPLKPDAERFEAAQALHQVLINRMIADESASYDVSKNVRVFFMVMLEGEATRTRAARLMIEMNMV